MTVSDVMSRDVQCVRPNISVTEAKDVMRRKRIHHLVVTDANRIVGVLSERDAGGRRGPAKGLEQTVADLMTTPAVTVEPTTTVRQAANVMRGRSIGCLVVVKSGRAVGIVTVSDLLELIGRGLERGTARATRWTLKQRAPRPRPKHVARA